MPHYRYFILKPTLDLNDYKDLQLSRVSVNTFMGTFFLGRFLLCGSMLTISLVASAQPQIITNEPDIQEPVSFDTPLATPANTVKSTPVAPPTLSTSATENANEQSTHLQPPGNKEQQNSQVPTHQTVNTLQTEASKTNLLETSITEAIKTRNWQIIETLLDEYSKQPDYDELLYRYAKGAMYRSQKQHHLAIIEYQKILDTDGSLHYPRFDLGVMLFENKQYQQAKKEISTAKLYLNPQMQRTADYYLQKIAKEQAWQPELAINYESTDNVNNAASARVINWGGRQWTKTEDSLPKSANGIRYGLGVNRDINLNGNHFMSIDVGADGVHYWDNQDYNEQSIRLKAGYNYQDINRSFAVLPFVEKNWLESSQYSTITGVKLNSSQRFNDKWRTTLGLGYNHKNYSEEAVAKRYDGHLFSANSTLMYSVAPTWLVYSGLSWSNDKLNSAEKSSTRYGTSLGSTKLFANGLGTRFNLSYHKREFDAPSTLVYNFVRKDNEYRAQGEFWHNKLSYKGLVPHLNVSYLKIDSNMDGFYSRDNLQWYMSINKEF